MKGFCLITGCAHPGIATIAREVAGHFPDETFYAVMGGFHLKDQGEESTDRIADEFRKLKIKKFVPLHCTGENALKIFKKRFGRNVSSAKVGDTITF